MPAETATRKDQMLAAAERLFRQKGYLATSIGDIEAETGVNAVGGKEDLLWAIASRAADEFFAAVEPIAAADEAAPLKLRRAIIAHVGVITRNLDAAAVYFNEWRHLSEPRRAEFARRRDEYEALFRGLMRDGIRSGIFAPVDEKFAALLVLSALNWTYQWYKPDGPMSPEEIGRTLADLLCNGLYRTA
ncbi:MAG: TetR/AcrR family transcriptional regulator [Chloroflexi bacterium]|nr:TetR/AcrR family transcriptional regulator [Chloroflexota bacterium]